MTGAVPVCEVKVRAAMLVNRGEEFIEISHFRFFPICSIRKPDTLAVTNDRLRSAFAPAVLTQRSVIRGALALLRNDPGRTNAYTRK